MPWPHQSHHAEEAQPRCNHGWRQFADQQHLQLCCRCASSILHRPEPIATTLASPLAVPTACCPRGSTSIKNGQGSSQPASGALDPQGKISPSHSSAAHRHTSDVIARARVPASLEIDRLRQFSTLYWQALGDNRWSSITTTCGLRRLQHVSTPLCRWRGKRKCCAVASPEGPNPSGNGALPMGARRI